MSPDLHALIELQSLDSSIADATTRVNGHPLQLAEADAKLTAATESVETAGSQLKESLERRREMEKEAAVYQGRLTKFKDQLSVVKTNREYQAMQHEIATAQEELGAVEEKVLERMMEADVISGELNQMKAAFAATRKEVDAEKARLTAELATVEAELARASAKRQDLAKQLDSRLVELYEQVARVRKGVAICNATRDGLCSVCHVRLRPPVFQQVRHNDSIVQCESCRRILYWTPPAPPVDAPSVGAS